MPADRIEQDRGYGGEGNGPVEDNGPTELGDQQRPTDVSADRRGGEAGQSPDSEGAADVLFASADRKTFEDRWTTVQTTFVDDPQGSVAEADHLVAEVMQTLARRFADHKAALEQQWGSGGEVGTEELRQAMHQYRAFFHRLLGA